MKTLIITMLKTKPRRLRGMRSFSLWQKSTTGNCPLFLLKFLFVKYFWSKKFCQKYKTNIPPNLANFFSKIRIRNICTPSVKNLQPSEGKWHAPNSPQPFQLFKPRRCCVHRKLFADNYY